MCVYVCKQVCGLVSIRDGKEPEPSKHEPNENPGFAKNRTEPYPVMNGREPETKYHGSYSVLSLNENVGTLTHFAVNEAFYLG